MQQSKRTGTQCRTDYPPSSVELRAAAWHSEQANRRGNFQRCQVKRSRLAWSPQLGKEEKE